MTGDFEAMALYAGQGVDRIDAIIPAGDRLSEIVAGAQRLCLPAVTDLGKPVSAKGH
jgi:hypothetical protein